MIPINYSSTADTEEKRETAYIASNSRANPSFYKSNHIYSTLNTTNKQSGKQKETI